MILPPTNLIYRGVLVILKVRPKSVLLFQQFFSENSIVPHSILKLKLKHKVFSLVQINHCIFVLILLDFSSSLRNQKFFLFKVSFLKYYTWILKRKPATIFLSKKLLSHLRNWKVSSERNISCMRWQKSCWDVIFVGPQESWSINLLWSSSTSQIRTDAVQAYIVFILSDTFWKIWDLSTIFFVNQSRSTSNLW